ncbi:DNA damage-inducible protein I [Acerihabitans arboris]|uniref:DNA damage-inducible protein I n=1 Tax=Acerihabitans arboris TaxID=2691583 RepID=A0A845SGW4_9GAMM|nr:DNA damage-inducible protein I [Acerihabitans arboris]NDL61928.1 DNA damage-inducible protein I [Acerihabitans arboris]
MRIEITLAKATPLPAGALEALTKEFTARIDKQFTDSHVQVRYAGANGISVMGGSKEDKVLITDILQETWESADDWFDSQ